MYQPAPRALAALRGVLLGMVVVLGGAWPLLAGPATADVRQGAPAADRVVELRLRDGSVIYGTVESESTDRIVVRTIAGAVVTVERAQVASIGPAKGTVIDGVFRPYDANATRLLFAPTGRSLPKGQGYVGVYEFILPFVQVGVTDRFSLGVGTPLLFLGDETSRPVWVTPKYQFLRRDRVSASAGVMHFHVFGEDARVGLAYAVATVGDDDNAWTTGAGWAYSRYYEDDFTRCFSPVPAPACEPDRLAKTEGSPVVMFGGERRLSRRVKLLSENYVFEGAGLASFGVRFLGERLSADLGAFVPLGVDDVIVVPVVNFVWTFGGEP